jgi:hypothetical protein
MSTSLTGLTGQPLLGMFELDAADTVVYARVERDGRGEAAPDLQGCSLLESGARFDNADEFLRRIHCFRTNDAPADGFDFDCRYEDGEMPVRVLLARVRDFAGKQVTKSILVHIRQRLTR